MKNVFKLDDLEAVGARKIDKFKNETTEGR